MFLIKAFAEARSGARGGRVSTPSQPTSVQGRFINRNGSYLGGSGRGRTATATYIAPNARRGR